MEKFKINSEKMISELNERTSKIKLEIGENQKNPERIATSKGQNLQNLVNIKKGMKKSKLNYLKPKKNILQLMKI